MIKNKTNLENVGSKSLVARLIFVACLCIVALRATFAEGISVQSSSTIPNLNSIVVSLTLSFILIILFAFWLCRLIISTKATYRFTAIEVPLILFLIAAGITAWFASNKRLAINNIIILVAPIMMAILLTQIADRSARVKLILIFIAALGFLSTIQCFEQLFSGNDLAIQQYQQDPESLLRPLGITKGTFQQFLLEHRIYSKGIKGFFVTSNSAGSFSILASFAGFALFYASLKKFKAGLLSRDYFIVITIAFIVVVTGLLITKSKGAISSAFLSALMLAIYLKFPKIIKDNPKKIITLALLIFSLAISAVIYLGQTQGSLPGGNSMLVRWQYWVSTAQMISDHWLVGVGPGNFANYYTQYKIPAALETVADPHNFILSIFAQLGLFGFLAFIVMIFLPIKKALSKSTLAPVENVEPKKSTKAFYIVYLALASAVLLIVRPMLIRVDTTSQDMAVVVYVAMVLYVMPVLIFIMGFFMFAGPAKNNEIKTDSVTSAAVFLGIIAVLIHNLIDFALFEPSVYTAFWVMIAVLIVLNLNNKIEKRPPIKLPISIKLLLVILIIALTLTSIVFGYCWSVKAEALINTAMDRPKEYNALLEEASQTDPLNTAALSILGNFFMHQYSPALTKNQESLINASDSFRLAIQRDPADSKNYEKLADIYSLIAQESKGDVRQENLKIALGYAEKAAKLYPGSGRIRFKYALIADQLEMTDLAINQYLKALEIENSFAAQFRTMYPGRDVVSRIGSDRYNQAKDRVEQLIQK